MTKETLSNPPVAYVTQEMWDCAQAELQATKGLKAHDDLLHAVEVFIHAYKPMRREGISQWHYCDICLSREGKFHSPSCEYANLRKALIEVKKKSDPLSVTEVNK